MVALRDPLHSLLQPAVRPLLATDVLPQAPSVTPPWRPNLTDIPTLKVWYDPTDPSKMSLDGLGGIDLLIPQIGAPDVGSYALGQPSQQSRPTTGSAPNGKTVIACPDGSRWLAKIAAPLSDRDLGLTNVLVWFVADASVGTNMITLPRVSAPAQRTDLTIITGSENFRYRFGDFGGDFGETERPIPVGSWNITATRNRDSWLNGGDLLTMTGGSLAPAPTADIELGRFVGGLGHWFICTGFTPDDQLRKLEGFAAWDLGVQASLVDGHPYKDQQP